MIVLNFLVLFKLLRYYQLRASHYSGVRIARSSINVCELLNGVNT